ncbi:SDR family NAD(P)-dependent oxidoreductase [Demequina sp. TTPB684]|uniref:SDR family NAD(P)-dependent oxidoreductase n=1 Tax=unclassified Demequina TaxID=2620311 RepID=UPI001CF5F02A|nr:MULTISPECIES: SDR family NAD(P)-dependent oxidoreductase [unclassified Demequina]MCB2413384.1 SDR family NAD(P)-dependent oxidoreductase [Demequina sp. TTPB684]UPU87397.1 SDR family NAD(P)-dependent oxidoreductase [Demequina sp. TMPB413]
MPQRTAVVTGASSGIGAATARILAAQGWNVIVGARRLDRLEQLADQIGGTAHVLDVTDQASVDAFCDAVDECHLVVNNAGGALGTTSVAEADDAEWLRMFEMNVMGTLRVTRALLPKLIASGDGQVVAIGSIAAHEPYPGGAGYNAAKHAVKALTRVLRLETKGQPVRVCEIDPGLVETEFSVVRFAGDQERADKVYEGMTPLTADDVAEAVAWVASRPAHVNIDQMLIMPRDQVSAQVVHRTA